MNRIEILKDRVVLIKDYQIRMTCFVRGRTARKLAKTWQGMYGVPVVVI